MNEHYFGAGATGIAYVESLTHALASDGDRDVTVFFSGTLESEWAGGWVDGWWVGGAGEAEGVRRALVPCG